MFSDPLLAGTPIIEAALPFKFQAKPNSSLRDFAICREEKEDGILLASGKDGPTETPTNKPKSSNSPKVPTPKPKSSGLGGLFNDELSDDDLFSASPATKEKEPPDERIPCFSGSGDGGEDDLFSSEPAAQKKVVSFCLYFSPFYSQPQRGQ